LTLAFVVRVRDLIQTHLKGYARPRGIEKNYTTFVAALLPLTEMRSGDT
jgi:hypothetical protein